MPFSECPFSPLPDFMDFLICLMVLCCMWRFPAVYIYSGVRLFLIYFFVCFLTFWVITWHILTCQLKLVMVTFWDAKSFMFFKQSKPTVTLVCILVWSHCGCCCYFLVTQTKPGVYFWFCICFCLNNVSSVSSSLRVLVPVQRAMQLHRTTEHSLLHPPPPICPPAVPTAKGDWAAAPSGLWTGQFVSFLLLIYRPLTGLN